MLVGETLEHDPEKQAPVSRLREARFGERRKVGKDHAQTNVKPMSGLRPITVITGASAGIGVALARVFARNGHELALVARREDRLRALADEIAATGTRKPLVIVADLQRNDAARVIGEVLAAQGAEPQYVVNNAGFGLTGHASAAACSMSARSPATCPGRVWRSITPARPMCCRSARRCTASLNCAGCG